MRSALSACLILAAMLLVRPAGEAAAEPALDWPLQEHARIFESAFARAGLDSALSGGEAFTLFVPGDAALEREGTAGLLQGVYTTPSNYERLVEVMGYHLVPGRKIDLESVASIEVRTFSGDTLSIDRRGDEILLDRHVRVTHSIDVGHGRIHLVSGLLWSDLVYDRSGRDYQAFLGGRALD